MPTPKGLPKDLYSGYVVIGTSAGVIKLIDLNKNRVLSTVRSDMGENCTVFALDWNAQGSLAIASTEH